MENAMKALLFIALMLGAASAVQAHDHMPVIDDSHPDAPRIRLCSRMVDVALQALNDRDKGRPMKLYQEDGSNEPKIANEIARAVFEEPQISSPKKAISFGRARCNELLLNQKN
jgi:hypothetical protein